jgi:hypothetical protein
MLLALRGRHSERNTVKSKKAGKEHPFATPLRMLNYLIREGRFDE